MKKIILVFVLFASVAVSAQRRVSPGFRGGLSLSDLTDIDGNRRADFYVGAFAAIKLTRWYTLQPEINYARQGERVTFYDNFDPNVRPIKDTWDLDYVGITVNNRFNPVGGLNLMVGPYLDFLVNHGSYVAPRNDVDTGLTMGVGYTFKNGIGVEARYKIGLVDVFTDYSDDWDDDYYDLFIVNNAFQLGVTYTFDLSKKQ